MATASAVKGKIADILVQVIALTGCVLFVGVRISFIRAGTGLAGKRMRGPRKSDTERV